MFKILNGLTPPYLSQMFTHSDSFHDYGLRSSRMNLALPKSCTDFYRNSFSFTGAKIWNDLPNSLKEETSLKRFMGKLDHYYQHQQNEFFNSKYVIYIVIFTLRILCKPNFNSAVYFNLIKCRIKIKGSIHPSIHIFISM